VVLEIFGVRKNIVDTRRFFFADELKACVDDDDILSVFEYVHVLTDFFDTSERYDACYAWLDRRNCRSGFAVLGTGSTRTMIVASSSTSAAHVSSARSSSLGAAFIAVSTV
jgi:hypothetical protein